LAEAYATPERHGYCPSWALKWNEYRKPRVLKELLEYSSDIICLQEVEVSAYEDALKTEMLNNGYKGYFKPKSRAHIAGIDRQKVDGCCIFYKANKLRLLDTH
jgi:CCR4-NOT transcription complex subunit 6